MVYNLPMSKEIRKSFKFRLEPTEDQLSKMFLFANHNRGLWNILVRYGKDLLEANADLPSEFDLVSKVSKAKYVEGYRWMQQAPAGTLLSTCKAYNNALWSGMKKIRKMPHFHKQRVKDSFTYHDGGPITLNYGDKTVKLPKLGAVKIRYSRKVKGQIKTATVTRKNKHWYVSFSCVVEVANKPHKATTKLGIDRGVVHLAVDSNGKAYDLPLDDMRKIQKRLKRQQRNLARKTKDSSNYKKNALKIAILHEKIANIRKDSIHKFTTELSKNHVEIVLEKLDTKKMTQAKGKSKATLNERILNSGWFMFQQFLGYKQAWSNGKVTLIDPYYTSQKCSSCGFTHPLNRVSQADFLCRTCGHSSNADHNAALNILAAGQAVQDCGGIGRKTPYEAVTYFPTLSMV